MTKHIETKISIQATPEQIWKILSNFSDYPRWNPFIQSIEGSVIVGKKIKARIVPPGGKGMTFVPKVLVFDRPKELCWKGKLLLPGLFDGEHYFMIQDHKDGTSTFLHGEKFSGILVGLFGKAFYKNVQKGFESMNEALKVECKK